MGVQGTSGSPPILEWVRAAFMNGVHLCTWYPRPLKTDREVLKAIRDYGNIDIDRTAVTTRDMAVESCCSKCAARGC
jgi:hypothetical protein